MNRFYRYKHRLGRAERKNAHCLGRLAFFKLPLAQLARFARVPSPGNIALRLVVHMSFLKIYFFRQSDKKKIYK